jgi:AcrB/AcrD/AcrF family
MWIVHLALKRPYTFVVLAMLIVIMGVITLANMATDMLPEIDIPVIAVINTYTGLSPEEVTDRTLTVEAQVANDKGELLPGTYADVTLTAGLSHGVSTIPVSALVFDAQGTRVATVDASSKVHFVRVMVGRDQGQEVEIVEGLTGNETVISTPPASLTEGTPVKVNQAEGPVAPAR